ncbi:aldo/keto reductase [Albidovulum sp.]|uniref:aldo/keto reductase n=1 Tax=Albidovulum sp. TaxID=1872424 RepID=UPI001D930768|nr:aldo/keto reductase [Paracoccaceae bacterium]
MTLPGTALSVSRLCLGGNRLGGELDRDRSFALLDAFVALGGNFVDTAHVYADWLPEVERSCSEKTIGRWRAARGLADEVLVATKIGHPVLGQPGKTRLDRASLRQDVEEARENLGLGCLPIVYLHRDDPASDPSAILGALEEMRAEGSILHYGASNWSAARLRLADEAAQAMGWEGFRANQVEWSLAARNPGTAAADLCVMDAAMIGWHRETGIAAIPYSAQAQGYFDKLAAGQLTGPAARHYDSAGNRARGARLSALAARHGVDPTQAMLALFRRAGFPVVPVVGCRTAAQVAASVRGVDLALAAEEVAPFLADLGLATAG